MRAKPTVCSGLALLTLASPAHATCDFTAVVHRAEQAALEARHDDGSALTQAAEDALGCGPVAEPEWVARFWNAQGVLHHVGGDIETAVTFFAAAQALSPEAWNDDFGPQMAQVAQSTLDTLIAPGELSVLGVYDGAIVAVDGTILPPRDTVPAGWHAVQAGPTEAQMTWARIAYVPSGTTLELNAKLTAPPPQVVPAPIPAPAPPPTVLVDVPPAEASVKRTPGKWEKPVLLTSAGAAILSGVTAGLALHQKQVMRQAPGPYSLNQAFERQQRLAWTSYLSGGLSLTGLGVVVVF